jgi:hypothetical protein
MAPAETDPKKYTPVVQQAPMYGQPPLGDQVQQYPPQAQGGYYAAPQPQGAYQDPQAQYPGQDVRFSQQSQAYSQQYQQPYDPTQQVGAQYNPHSATVPGRVELQSVEQSPAFSSGRGGQGGRGATGGRYEVQG